MKRGFLNSKKVKKTPLYADAPKQEQDSRTVAVPGPAIPVAPAIVPGPGFPDLKQKLADIKAPYGKVENNELPEGYEPTLMKIEETPYHRKEFHSNQVLMTTVPFEVMEGPRDPDGHVQWITRGATKLKVINAPGFPKPVPKPVQPSHIIKDTPDMGKGVFATRDIKFGELIFAERPFIIVPRVINYSGVDAPAHFTKAQQQHAALLGAEKRLEALVERMTEEDRKEYNDLYNSHKEDGSGPLLGIIRSNGYGVEGLADGPLDTIELTGYTGVSRAGSRLNHSCMPNVGRVTFSQLSLSFQFTAAKDIKAGEQLCYPYCSADQSVAERREELAPYGFVCRCPACENATLETDLLRKGFSQRIQHYIKLSDEWILDPNLSERVLDPVVALRDAIIKEGLNISVAFGAIYIVFHKVYTKLGQYDRAESCMREIGKFRMAHEKRY